jgi:hypothetical protein
MGGKTNRKADQRPAGRQKEGGYIHREVYTLEGRKRNINLKKLKKYFKNFIGKSRIQVDLSPYKNHLKVSL